MLSNNEKTSARPRGGATKTPRKLFPGALTTCQSERCNRKEQLSGTGFILSPLFIVKAHLGEAPYPQIFETLGNP